LPVNIKNMTALLSVWAQLAKLANRQTLNYDLKGARDENSFDSG
jgi:hypothetical protein